MLVVVVVVVVGVVGVVGVVVVVRGMMRDGFFCEISIFLFSYFPTRTFRIFEHIH